MHWIRSSDYYDGDEPLTGARGKPLPSTRGASMMRAWHDAVDTVVKAAGGDPDVSYTVLNRDITQLRKDHSNEAIVTGFHRFAMLVASGKVDVRDRAAWFSFYSRRNKMIRTVVYTDQLPDEVPAPTNPFDIPVQPPSNPFES